MEKKIIIIPNKILNTFILIKDKGYNKLQVYYDGSGDSGAINDINFLNDMNSISIENIIENTNFIKEWLYEIIDEAIGNMDWWNNEGGCGNIIINLNTFELISYHSQRTTIDYENNLQLSI
jgi:hypothetical protein